MEEVEITDGCADITEDIWDRILKLYLRTYRGPNAANELKRELVEYKVLIKNAIVAPGRYVRYMHRGIIDTDLRRGGWVVKCNTKSIYLRDGRRTWIVSRLDNYIFVRNEENGISATQGVAPNRKSTLRLLAEEAIYKDDRYRRATTTTNIESDIESESESLPRIKYIPNFKD